jgi:hypothetical protein
MDKTVDSSACLAASFFCRAGVGCRIVFEPEAWLFLSALLVRSASCATSRERLALLGGLVNTAGRSLHDCSSWRRPRFTSRKAAMWCMPPRLFRTGMVRVVSISAALGTACQSSTDDAHQGVFDFAVGTVTGWRSVSWLSGTGPWQPGWR